MDIQWRERTMLIEANQFFLRASSFNGLHDVIKTPNARGIRENVWIAYQLIDDLLLSAPIIAEAAQMRDNEV
jgi:hypothetical protein